MLSDAILAPLSDKKHQLDNITKVELLFEYAIPNNTVKPDHYSAWVNAF